MSVAMSARTTMAAPTLPAAVRAATMRPAETTPAKMEVRASTRGMPRTKAIMAPVQAPVPGKGTPTKAASAVHRLSPSRTWDDLERAFWSGALRRRWTMGALSARRSGTMGIMLPTMQRRKVLRSGTPMRTPTGMAPRSSTTGMPAIAATITESGRPDPLSVIAMRSPRCGSPVAPAVAAAIPGISKLVAAAAAARARVREGLSAGTACIVRPTRCSRPATAYPWLDATRFAARRK
mmetsp:Transcript_1063/g.3131  ORF Transcript_1063/g.3131 Transcript_1063/m.3131 type:complete len:236 (+) Transcript_1063:240-947(+)